MQQGYNPDSSFQIFKSFWDQAQQAFEDPNTQNTATSNAKLLSSGFSLIYNNCADFFRERGRLQQRLTVIKDSAGVLVPFITGALGLAEGAGNAIPIVGLTGGAVTSGITVVAQDFLFGAENIDDVRVLTLNAIGAHQSTVTALLKNNPNDANFGWVVNQLMDDQSICEGPHILALAKDAIAKGNVVAYTTATVPALPGTPGGAAAPAGGGAPKAAAAPAGGGAPKGAVAPAGATTLPTRVGVRVSN